MAPWFEPNVWGGGGYLKVHQAVGSLIDWVCDILLPRYILLYFDISMQYNVQFYNREYLLHVPHIGC